MDHPVSVAIETSCRRGGVALGAGEGLVEMVAFPADGRHAVQLVARLDELLLRHGRRPVDLEEVYVSVGPGSFTGLRVGITVARTLAGAVDGLRCVAVPTAHAVAAGAAALDFDRLAVVMDAKDGKVYVTVFERRDGAIRPAGEPALVEIDRFARTADRPITLVGEALGCQDLTGDGITIADQQLWLPTAAGVWHAGRRLAAAGRFDPPNSISPLYLRQPEAVRLWEKRHGRGSP